jgi:hypothetical protein
LRADTEEVKRLWCQGNQNIVRFAEMLRVSPRALRFRRVQLHLEADPSKPRTTGAANSS